MVEGIGIELGSFLRLSSHLSIHLNFLMLERVTLIDHESASSNSEISVERLPITCVKWIRFSLQLARMMYWDSIICFYDQDALLLRIGTLMYSGNPN